MTTDDATNLAPADEDTSAVAGVADQADGQTGDQSNETTDQLDPDDPDNQEVVDEDEEIEHEGQKYKLPKTLAKEFKEGTLRQADYTRKTQEVANERKALETRQAEIVQQAETQAQTLEQRVQLKQVEAQLQQYQGVDWRAYSQQFGAEEATAAMAQWQQLRDAQATLSGEITTKETEHRLSRERMTATALQEAEQVLSKELEGYGRDTVQAIAQTASQYGITAGELRDSLVGDNGKADVRAFKVLAELHKAKTQLAALQKTQTTARTAEKQASVQPAKTVGAKSTGYKPGLDDSLPMDEWLRRRNAQRKRA